MDRRTFLQQSGLLTIASLTAIGSHRWIARANSTDAPKRLIVIFLRGAIDGLNVVVPHQESAYYEARPTIAIPKPNQPDGALDLNGTFGLHPALAPILPLWQQGSLAFVHACGSPDATRSHFDAQDYMESGTPGNKRTASGWMNRLLAATAQPSSIQAASIQAISVGATIPRILAGRMPVAVLGSGNNATRPLPIDRPQVQVAFDRLYSGTSTIAKTYQEAKQARQALITDLDMEMQQANNGAPLPTGFSIDARHIARIMVKDPRVQLAFLALGGWDTHVNQAPQLARNLKGLGQGLAVLQQELGALYSDTVILVMSEFGRTVQENGNRGTDHGHANVMWMMGGNVQGGKVYGDFPGLRSTQLYQERDLAITTDFRTVIASTLTQHLRLNDSQLDQVLPQYSSPRSFTLFRDYL